MPILALAVLCAASPGRAQGPAAPADSIAPAPVERVVGRILVQGNTHTDSDRITRTFGVSPGSRFSAEAVRRGLRKLFALGLFEDADVREIARGDTVDLALVLRERSRITRVEITGNQKRETSELEKKVFLRAGEPYSTLTASQQVDSLLAWYRDEGFPRAAIEAETDTTGQQGGVLVRLRVTEGERVRIKQIRFEGVSAFPGKKLRKAMATRRKGFFGGGQIKDETFTEDRERIAAYYRDRGYRDARVTDVRLEPGRRPRDLTLVVTVDEGRLHHLGGVRWEGATVVAPDVLQGLWKRSSDEVYSRSRIERTAAMAYGEYAEQGYLYLGIDPLERVRADTVDVVFQVSEGRPSSVRYVNIAGNRGTREKVIRREIDIHEGDRFRRSLLMRTQGDLMRLGFFEAVEIDFQPAESTDVDLTLRVKEKSVGTASAGAGYTGETGMTFFVEIGHNNVLGNGQSLQLHLERGARREDYYVSFTEPWFRDTPTLLGFSVFNSERDRDIYDEKRVGASVRLGRPLAWPDYSRGSIGYRIEDVTIGRGDSPLTAQQEAALSSIRFDEGVRTSSVELGFSRNSTDNPFYPTRGTRLSANSEFAGGPFGGSVNFNKQRVEGRAYLPSVLRGITTMLRGRVGFAGEYRDQHRELPAYERFRLGGGTTLDPLRGYDDYQVVPRENVVDVQVPFDTLSSGPDSGKVLYSSVRTRYPGGRWMTSWSLEQQFAIAHPLHGVVFLDAGNAWNYVQQYRPFDLKLGAGVGMRLEIPLLGNIGFDYAYGFHRDDGPRWVGHFLLGPSSF